MEAIKAGDRVKVSARYGDALVVGHEGTVVDVDGGAWPVAVMLDTNPYRGLGVTMFHFDTWEVDVVDEHIPASEEAPC